MTEQQQAWNWAKQQGIITDQQPDDMVRLDEVIFTRWKLEMKNLNPK